MIYYTWNSFLQGGSNRCSGRFCFSTYFVYHFGMKKWSRKCSVISDYNHKKKWSGIRSRSWSGIWPKSDRPIMIWSKPDRRSNSQIRYKLGAWNFPSCFICPPKFAAAITKFAVFRRRNSASINHVNFAHFFCIHTSISKTFFSNFQMDLDTKGLHLSLRKALSQPKSQKLMKILKWSKISK